MAVLTIEGFKSVAREKKTALLSSLTSAGWTLFDVQGVGNQNYSYCDYSIEADTIFPNRNVCKINVSRGSSVARANGMRWAFGRTPTSVVIGMVLNFNHSGHQSNTAVPCAFGLGTLALVKTSDSSVVTAPTLPNDCFMQVDFSNTSVANSSKGALYESWDGVKTTRQWDTRKDYHVELLIERDTKRCRTYIDGELVIDKVFAGVEDNLNRGFSFYLSQEREMTTFCELTISNLYALELDAVHTGKLGPAARVIEESPTNDVSVDFIRSSTAQNSNAEVMQQSFGVAAPDYVSAMNSGDMDLYLGPNAVAANASKIYGASIKVRVGSLASGDHHMATVVKSGEHISASPSFMLNASMGYVTKVLDASVNPATGQVWTPSDLAASNFGYKLID